MDRETKACLIEAYLKYCGKLSAEQQTWLNGHYLFLANHEDAIGYDRCVELIKSSKFKSLDINKTGIIDCVINNSCYEINIDNLFVVTKTLGVGNVTKDNLNLTRLFSTQNVKVRNYVERNINDVIKCLKDQKKDECSEELLYIINNNNIEEELKKKYLGRQTNKIEKIKGIKDKNYYDFVVQCNLLEPTWENVSLYFIYKGSVLADELIKYLQTNAIKLSTQSYNGALPNVNKIFNSLSVSNGILLDKYKLLLQPFKGRSLENCNGLKQLDRAHLLVLIENEMIPFNEKFVNEMGNTEVFAEYLISRHDEFISALMSKTTIHYNITKEVAIKVLKSTKFSDDDKREVTKVINIEIKKEKDLADIFVGIYEKTDFLNENNEVLLTILENAQRRDKTISLATKMIEVASNDVAIKDILTALGGDYANLSLKKGDIMVKFQIGTRALLEVLKQKEFISSYKFTKNARDVNGSYYLVQS